MSHLSRSRAHDFPEGSRPKDCTRCGFTIREGQQKRDLCPGMDQTGQLARTGSLDQSKPLSPVSDSNSGREHQKDEAYRDRVRNRCCLICGASPPSDAAHVRSWGAGHGDEDNLVPLCRTHHSEQHTEGIETFQRKHDIDLEAEAERIGNEYREGRG